MQYSKSKEHKPKVLPFDKRQNSYQGKRKSMEGKYLLT